MPNLKLWRHQESHLRFTDLYNFIMYFEIILWNKCDLKIFCPIVPRESSKKIIYRRPTQFNRESSIAFFLLSWVVSHRLFHQFFYCTPSSFPISSFFPILPPYLIKIPTIYYNSKTLAKVQRADLTCHVTSARLQWFEFSSNLRSECALKKQNIQILPEPVSGHVTHFLKW